MARLRYVRNTAAQLDAATGATRLKSTVRSIRALYETEPEIAAALLPKPLEPSTAPEIFVQFANVAMQLSKERTLTIGAVTVGVACSYEGRPGYYVLAMPMEGEFVVIGGREKYGEPKKIAETEFSLVGDEVRAKVTRHGVTFLELSGTLGDPTGGPRQFTENFFCFKAMPSIAAGVDKDGGFDGEVFLTQLDWERNYSEVRHIVNGEIILRESPYDPLVDVPVKRLLQMEFAEGTTQTSGQILRAVPGEWLEPFLVQRYDDPQEGIEIALASEQEAGHG